MRFLVISAVAALAPSELGSALRKVGLQEEAAALLLDAAPGCELTPDDAARKLASHIRDAAGRRDRHDAVCRRVAAACRSLHSDVRRDAPLWRLGLDLEGPGRRAVDVSIRRDNEWSFVEVTVALPRRAGPARPARVPRGGGGAGGVRRGGGRRRPGRVSHGRGRRSDGI